MREEGNVTKDTLSSSTVSSPALSWHLLGFVSQRARRGGGGGSGGGVEVGYSNDVFEFLFQLDVGTLTHQLLFNFRIR